MQSQPSGTQRVPDWCLTGPLVLSYWVALAGVMYGQGGASHTTRVMVKGAAGRGRPSMSILFSPNWRCGVAGESAGLG